MRIWSVESWSFSGFAPSLAPSRSRPATRSHRSIAQSLQSLPLSLCPRIIFTGEDGGATNKEPSQQASPSMAAAATAAATMTILALVAGLIAALRMKYMSADRRSGSSEGVANTTKADKNGKIKVRVVVDVLRASNATNMRFRNLSLSLSLSRLLLSPSRAHQRIARSRRAKRRRSGWRSSVRNNVTPTRLPAPAPAPGVVPLLSWLSS